MRLSWPIKLFYMLAPSSALTSSEIYVRINSEMRRLWQAVDHEDQVLKSLVTKNWDKAAALQFIKKAMKRTAGQATSGSLSISLSKVMG